MCGHLQLSGLKLARAQLLVKARQLLGSCAGSCLALGNLFQRGCHLGLLRGRRCFPLFDFLRRTLHLHNRNIAGKQIFFDILVPKV